MLERGRLSNADYITTMSQTKAYSTVEVLHDLLTSCMAGEGSLAEGLDRMDCPVVATSASESPEEQVILYANDAFCRLVGQPREQLSERPLHTVYAEGVSADASRRFGQSVQRDGASRMLLTVDTNSGGARRVEATGLRVDASSGLGMGAAFVVLVRPLEQAELIPAGAPVPESYRIALLVETLFRRYIRENYRQGMHPAQWSALRFFKLSPPDERTLTSFAKAHHTTMGTASTTVSTLVGKGYLKKHGFRGPIEITPEGEKVLQQDPLGTVAEALAEMPEDERAWARHTLTTLVEGLDGDND